MNALALVITILSGAAVALAQQSYTYVGQLGPRSALIAWGNTKGPNTIGRSSASLGPAIVSIGGRQISADRNWALAEGLEPDHEYPYEVSVNGKPFGSGKIRTYPEHATKLCFFVIGDFGTGTAFQNRVAGAMWQEYQRRQSQGEPVRFVLTVGDNIYANLNVGMRAFQSGDDDAHWEPKFFHPYEKLIREVPFYPSLGNHDGNGSENRDDLDVYLDNFFFPGNRPARWYTFQFADLAQFFALDSTNNSEKGPPRKAYLPNGEQFQWFRKAIAESSAPWKIPYWHHPLFTAGPYHGASLNELKHFAGVFQRSGVKVVFSGHEHNFQFSEQGPATGGIRYVLSGAGGQLREGDVRNHMAAAHIEGWAAERHFLVVEIEGKEMRITPISDEPVKPKGKNGAELTMPLIIRIP